MLFLGIEEYNQSENQAIQGAHPLTPNAFDPEARRTNKNLDLGYFISRRFESLGESFLEKNLGALAPEEFDDIQTIAGILLAFHEHGGYQETAFPLPLDAMSRAILVRRLLKDYFEEYTPRVMLLGDDTGFLSLHFKHHRTPTCLIEWRQREYLFQNNILIFHTMAELFRSFHYFEEDAGKAFNHLFNGVFEGVREKELGGMLPRLCALQSFESCPPVHLPWWKLDTVPVEEQGAFDAIIVSESLVRNPKPLLEHVARWAAPQMARDPFESGVIIFEGWERLSTTEKTRALHAFSPFDPRGLDPDGFSGLFIRGSFFPDIKYAEGIAEMYWGRKSVQCSERTIPLSQVHLLANIFSFTQKRSSVSSEVTGRLLAEMTLQQLAWRSQ